LLTERNPIKPTNKISAVQLKESRLNEYTNNDHRHKVHYVIRIESKKKKSHILTKNK